ncbi:MAG: serine/threonine protein kinase [Cyanobacteria bacterium]|nr:serine/threonine protein kinase [Cyanobacteriota bacterium]
MAEAEITLKYKELPVALAYKCLVVAVPIILMFTVWSAVQIIMAPHSIGSINWSAFSVLMAGELLALCAVVLLTILCADDTIFVTRDGMSLPFVLCPSLGTRTQRGWSSLKSVHFLPDKAFGRLVFKFTKGPPVTLRLHKLESHLVEDLIVAIDVWGGGTDTFPALLEARAFLAGEDELVALSHTEMWEDELTRRFGATNFIPLEPQQAVRGGELVVERQIAFGGMSAVYAVRDKRGQGFVLKESVVPDESDGELRKKACELLAREAVILAQLSHPRIASIIDHFVEDNRDYLLLQQLHGQDLRRLIKEFGPQPERNVVEWAIQLTEILEYLHGQKSPVIHRDLTPDNLILDENGQICLIDFGAANFFIGTATGTIIGKQAYIAPEQLRGKASTESDLYSLGATIFYLLTGKDPEPLAVSHPKEVSKEVSKQIDELVASCTEMEIEDRIRTASEVRCRLKAISIRQT